MKNKKDKILWQDDGGYVTIFGDGGGSVNDGVGFIDEIKKEDILRLQEVLKNLKIKNK